MDYDGTMPDIGVLLQNYGLPIALVVFFIWEGKIRETRMVNRIEESEKYVRGTLSKLIADSTSALTETTVVMKRLENILERVEIGK